MAHELTGDRVQMLVIGRRQRALIHGVIVLRRLQLLLIVALSAPSAIRAKYDILTVFHFRLPVSIIGPKANGSEIDISDDGNRKNLSTARSRNRRKKTREPDSRTRFLGKSTKGSIYVEFSVDVPCAPVGGADRLGLRSKNFTMNVASAAEVKRCRMPGAACSIRVCTLVQGLFPKMGRSTRPVDNHSNIPAASYELKQRRIPSNEYGAAQFRFNLDLFLRAYM
jgi:hypothetical protein